MRYSKYLERIFLAILSIVSFSLILYILYYSIYGFDFTDESFYINWVLNPSNYSWSTSQFGFIYSPIYILFQGNIIRVRQINILVTYLLSFLLIKRFLKTNYLGKLDLKHTLILVMSFSTSCLLLFSFWLIFPNYNTLTFQGTIIFVFGIIGIIYKKSILDEFLVSLGGWFVFMAKPSTAVFLIILFCIIYFTKKINVLRLLRIIGFDIILFIIGAYLIDKSIFDFIKRIVIALNFSKFDGMKHTLIDSFRLDYPLLSNKEYLIIIILILSTFYILRKINFKNIITDIIFYVYLAIYSALLVYVFSRSNYTYYMYSIFGTLLPISIFLLCFTENKNIITKLRKIDPLFYILLLLPYATSFGSTNNYWLIIGTSSFFYLVSSLVLLKSLIVYSNNNLKKSFYLLAVYYLILTFNVVNHAIENPYRQPKFDKNTIASIEVSDNNFLYADQTIISYMDEILINTEKVGFIPDTPIIDLTGQSPGVLYLMKANAIGQPWMIGGLKGSDKLSYESLKLTSCVSLKNSWLLIEPSGPRSINVNVLSYFGLDFYKDYRKVAEWETPISLGGYTYVRNQILLEPNRDNSIIMKNCQNIQ